MRQLTPLALLFLLTACGEQYTAPSLYQATTAECSNWADVSRFDLPRGVSVIATAPTALDKGGLEIGVVYTLPRGLMAKFDSKSFNITLPKGAFIAKAKIATIYQRGSNQRAEIVEVVERFPGLLAAIGTSDETQWRMRLQVDGKLPQRFDLVLPKMVIAEKTYPVRTFTYRYFEDRKAYGMCT